MLFFLSSHRAVWFHQEPKLFHNTAKSKYWSSDRMVNLKKKGGKKEFQALKLQDLIWKKLILETDSPEIKHNTDVLHRRFCTWWWCHWCRRCDRRSRRTLSRSNPIFILCLRCAVPGSAAVWWATWMTCAVSTTCWCPLWTKCRRVKVHPASCTARAPPPWRNWPCSKPGPRWRPHDPHNVHVHQQIKKYFHLFNVSWIQSYLPYTLTPQLFFYSFDGIMCLKMINWIKIQKKICL